MSNNVDTFCYYWLQQLLHFDLLFPFFLLILKANWHVACNQVKLSCFQATRVRTKKHTHFICWNVAVDGGEKTNVAQNQTKSKTF